MVADGPGGVRGMFCRFLVRHCGALFGIGSVRYINRTSVCEESFTDGGSKLLKPRHETFSGKMKDVSNSRPGFDESLIVREPSQNIGKALMRAWWGPCLLLVEQLQPEYQLTFCVTRSQVNPIYAALGRLNEARCALLLPSLLPGLLPSL